MIYAGAIMVLFLFVIMMLNLGPKAIARAPLAGAAHVDASRHAHPPAVLLARAAVRLARRGRHHHVGRWTQGGGLALFGPYLLAVELASMLLLAALVGAYHLGRRYMRARQEDVS